MDQRMTCYTVNSKSKRWTIQVLSYILDTARVNGQTLWSLNNGKEPTTTNSFNFAFTLAEDLIKPFIESRNTKHLPTITKKKVKNVLKVPTAVHSAPAVEDAAPAVDFDAPAVPAVQRSEPAVDQAAPVAEQSAPAVEQAEPAVDQGAPGVEQDEPTVELAAPRAAKRRCYACVTEVNQLDVSERRTKQRELSRVAFSCNLCHESVCKNHFVSICINCKNNLK